MESMDKGGRNQRMKIGMREGRDVGRDGRRTG